MKEMIYKVQKQVQRMEVYRKNRRDSKDAKAEKSRSGFTGESASSKKR